jgi:hypothetical protein
MMRVLSSVLPNKRLQADGAALRASPRLSRRALAA